MNKEPIICINTSYSPGDSEYPIISGSIITSYSSPGPGYLKYWMIPIPKSYPYRPYSYLMYNRSDFITLSEYRESLIDKILT